MAQISRKIPADSKYLNKYLHIVNIPEKKTYLQIANIINKYLQVV